MSDPERERNWITVVHNYGDQDIKKLEGLNYKYLIIGKELGAENSPHLQVYVSLKNAVTLSSFRRKLAPWHVEKARGSPQQNQAYCSKEGNFKEYGQIPAQGKRNDLESVRDEIKSNPNISTRDLIESHPSALARYPRFLEACRKAYGKPVALTWSQSPNLWFFGPAGSGKSSTARSLSSSLYVKMANKWWDGYDGEEDVLIDDFHPEQAKYLTTYLKIWSDRYPFPAEVKGGSLFIRPKRIFITTQYTMPQLFELSEDIAAIDRRFSQGVTEEFKQQ